MEKLPPIPSPPGTAFREFRIGFLPYLAFLGAVALTVYSWRSYVGPSALLGEVEMVRTIVSASQPSRLTVLKVSALDQVTAGQPVAELVAADPRYLEAQASLSRARLEFVRVTVEPKIRRENNVINFTKLRLDWLSARVQLATAKAQLTYAEAEADRTTRLSRVTNGIPFVSVQELQLAQRELDSLRAQIHEQTVLVNEVSLALDKLGPDEKKLDDELPASIRAALAVEQKAIDAIEAQLNPTVLLSPISGFVSVVHRRAGEAVMPGEPILTISGTRSEKIIAYLRQPVRMEPRVGMAMEIRSRSYGRAGARGEIVSVGGQMEPILPELLPLRASGNSVTEYGLPVMISVPPELTLIPGEIVDLRPVN
jgi:multidrug resistance efflux pump